MELDLYSNMPKIALIYTGLLRSWKQCKGNHYDNIWIPNKPDLFFYTDSDPYELMEEREKWYYDVIRPDSKFIKDENVRFYPDPFKEHRYHERKAAENTYYQTMRQWHCGFIGFCLVPHGYDIYVRIRPDITFNGPLDFSKFDCSEKKIYIPEGNDYWGVNDQFAFGNHSVMKDYYSIYQNHHELWHEGATFCSELMQRMNLVKQGIEIVRFGSPQQQIVR